jgi:hypothetical protein
MNGEYTHKHHLTPEEQWALANDVHGRYGEMLLRKKNVVGVGVGLNERDDRDAFRYALVVMVSAIVPESQIDSDDRIPEEIEGVPVEVREMGTFWAS